MPRTLPPVAPEAPETAFDAAQLWRSNRARLADDHVSWRAKSTGKPAHLKIELTNFCNLACPMCPHEQMERAVGYMKPELFRRVIDLCAPELEFAYLHHLGESLFHGRIGELIAYARARGVRTGLSTNATYLDARKGRALLDAGLDFLVISLDGATPDTYERMRVGGDFQTTMRNVRAFFEMKRARPASELVVVVQMIVTAQNRAEVEPFAETWRKTGAQVMIKEARDWAGQVKLVQLGAPPDVHRVPCKMLWTELTVLWDGKVVPCANVFEHDNVLGDLSTQSLDEIWNGEPMKRLRALHLADDVGRVPVCATCPRHPFDHTSFVAQDQLAARIRNYVRDDTKPRPGLS